ncbi:MAG: hypothetical protein K9J79_04700 [Desulfobacteraceae bacterium]|nr:hypothetical protein [Desulfobacteraceae bacterium]
MSGTNPFENIYPELLESSLEEVGGLIGQSLTLDQQALSQGSLEDVFKRPKKKFVLAGFKLKDDTRDRVHLLVDLNAAIELAGLLIMLPKDEIKAAQKQARLEGELEDACSEIVNIISGTINTAFHEAFAKKKLHFTMGEIRVCGPKDEELPLPAGSQSCLSGQMVLEGQQLGLFQFFFPHDLVSEPEAAEAQPQAARAEQPEEPSAGDVQPEPEPGKKGGGIDPGVADDLLLQGLEAARGEMEALLGDTVTFTDQQTGYRKKADLLTRTKGKQVLTSINATGESEGRVFMLLPLKDAVYLGGVLLMMPEESIAATVKQGKFEGEVADSFGEIANILVGCYSNQFQGGAPLKLKLKKDHVDTLVPAQVDPAADEPFPAVEYYAVSARIQMGEKIYGPLEMLFPLEILGLEPQPADSEKARPSAGTAAQSQKAGQGQKNDTIAEPAGQKAGRRIISIIDGDSDQLEAVEKSVAEEGMELARFSLDSDFKQELGRENPGCVFLFINRVNEQGLAKTIKVRSALNKDCPLIVAGPEWTKSTVLKARKYGATDILATPAEKDVIRKKYRKYL